MSQLQALANIGVTTAMVAHEINNLLTPLQNYSQLALLHLEDKELTEKALHKTVQNCQRVSKVMKSILAAANGEANEKQQVNLRAIVDEIFSCLCRDFAKDGITVKVDIGAQLFAYAVPIELQQALMNIILNARDAMLPSGGTLDICAFDCGGEVKIDISDTGCGIEQENIDKIFELFFTTKKTADCSSETSGSGLGLAFCKQVIEANDGSICVKSIPNEGTTFTITLPKR